MGYPTKIATCCFCGSKTMLKPDSGRHELGCANCGAPLRNLKMLPKAPETAKPAVSHQPSVRRFPEKARTVQAGMVKPKKSKKRKTWLKSIAEEVFDLVEDVFD